MIGSRYWATGITVTYWRPEDSAQERASWSGSIDFYDDGFANDSVHDGRIATEGKLHTRYRVTADSSEQALTAVVDVLLRDAARLGIEWQYKHLYYPGDGENNDFPPPPDWRRLLAAQCDRIGWQHVYAPLEATT